MSKSATAQLRDCLKLQNNAACLNAIVENILQVGSKNLDPIIPASHQKSALITIGEELGGLYPDIFADEDSAKRIYIALQIVMNQHSLNRQSLKQKEDKAGQSMSQEKERIPTFKSASNKSRSSPSAPETGSNEQDTNQAPVDPKKYAKDKPSRKRKPKKIRRSLRASTSGCKEQEQNIVPMNVTMHTTDNLKASDTKSMIPHVERSSSTPIQGDEQNGDQTQMHAIDKVCDEQDEDHVPMDVTMHTMDMVSENKKVKIPDGPRPLSTLSQGFSEQDANQAPIHVAMHAKDKASAGKITAETILRNRYSSSIPTHEQDEDQAPINLASIANTPSASSLVLSPSFTAYASQPVGSISSSFSQPRGRALFVPHVSKSQPRLDNTPSQPRGAIDDSWDASRPRPVIYSSAFSASSNLSTSKDSPMYGSIVRQSDKIKSMHHFLEACVPSMSHLLPHFIDYGCTHEGFLLAVSMWPSERIRRFLEDVVSGPDGQLISPMEQMVLENHLTQYFKV